MTSVVPPHKVWESPNPVHEAFEGQDAETRQQMTTRWHEAIEAMLPPCAHHAYGEYTWTTPGGVWRLGTDSGSPSVLPWVKVVGPHGKLVLRDPNIEHIRSVLTVLGAIEPVEDVP